MLARLLVVALPLGLLACGGSDAGNAFDEPGGADTGSPGGDTSPATDSNVSSDSGGRPDTGSRPDTLIVIDAEPPPPRDSGSMEEDTAPPPPDSSPFDVAPPDVAVVTCTEPGGKVYGGHCYFPSGSSRFWWTGRDNCAAAGAHLVTITSDGEQSFVQSVGTNDRWIGLSRIEGTPAIPSSYKWITGEATTYTRWAGGEPNGSGTCARMRPDGTWADFACNSNLIAICERE